MYEGRIWFTLTRIMISYLVCPFRQKRLAYLGLNNVKWHWSSLNLVNWLISALSVTKLNAGSTAEAAGCGQSEPGWRVDWCSSRTRSGSNGDGYEDTKHGYVWHHCWLLQWQSPRQWSASKGTSFRTAEVHMLVYLHLRNFVIPTLSIRSHYWLIRALSYQSFDF